MTHVNVETVTLLVLLYNALIDYNSAHVECVHVERSSRNAKDTFEDMGAGNLKCRFSRVNVDCGENASNGTATVRQRTEGMEGNSSRYEAKRAGSERDFWDPSSALLSRFQNDSISFGNFTNDSHILDYYNYGFSGNSDSYYFNSSVVEIDYLMQRTFRDRSSEVPTRNPNFTTGTDVNGFTIGDARSNETDYTADDFGANEPLANGTAEGDPLIALFKSRYPVKSWYELGWFTEDYLRRINRHWLQFEPPLRSSHYVLAVLYSVLMTIGVCGNCLVIFMYARCRSLRIPANTLVINLAVSDFIMLIKMPIFIFNSVYFGPVLGESGCQLYGFLGGLTGTVSITTLAAIALDRYYAIVHPLDPLRKTTHLRARFSVLFVWSYGCVFAGLPLTKLGLNHYVPEGYLTSCSFDYLTTDMNSRMFIFVFFVAAWVLPFSVITVCYFGIFLEVVKTGSAASCRHGQEAEKRRTEIRLASMVIGIIGLWFLAWTPYAVVALLGIFGFHNRISPLGSMVPALFCKCASCIDPYVYAFTHPRFRREIMRLFMPSRSSGSQRYQSRVRSQTYVSRVSSIQIKPQDICPGSELYEMKVVKQQIIKSPWRRTLLFSNALLSCNTKSKTSKSLQNSKKDSSEDYSITNSSPF